MVILAHNETCHLEPVINKRLYMSLLSPVLAFYPLTGPVSIPEGHHGRSSYTGSVPERITARWLLTLFLLLITAIPAASQSPREQRLSGRAMNRLEDVSDLFTGWHHLGQMGVDSVAVDIINNKVSVWLSSPVTHIPIRFPWLESLRADLHNRLGFRFRNYEILLFSAGRRLEEYIPNYYRAPYIDLDSSRMTAAMADRPPVVAGSGYTGDIPGPGTGVAGTKAPPRQLVRRQDREYFGGGLSGAHIALWPSHGYYYEASRDRWEWQRARLYSTIEDLYPFAYIRPYLLPMLENAGATVLLPRERDIRHHEVVVDNDGSHGSSEIVITGGERNGWETVPGGFALSDTLFEGDNPFRKGTHLRLRAEGDADASVTYIPAIPDCGEYAVYVSWAKATENVQDVIYTVNHTGGITRFMADQTMGYGTWIYLGTFMFREGADMAAGSVTVSVPPGAGGYITTDAVRFGGGTGNIARRAADEYVQSLWSLHDDGTLAEKRDYADPALQPEWKLSGRPRYMEGARYWLQYAGMPDSSVYSLNRGRNDYNDDFMSRGEWVNYLMGAPLTLTGEPDPGSPLIPVDAVLAFHTDAGVTPSDSVIGTLAIYSSVRTGGVFHDGRSRMASRDLSDIIQTQIVEDIRLQTDGRWTRRGLWDRQYSEAWRPHAPALLLELLSHQNLADMRFGLDPRFRFLVSRSIYKGMLRYLAWEQGREPVVQPLSPEGMYIHYLGGSAVRLGWREQEDPFEPTAVAEGYIVHTRIENGGFDNGKRTTQTFMDIDLPESGTIYGFRVTAVNSGGESLPGEILSVLLPGEQEQPGAAREGAGEVRPVLVVNGFTRVSGPAVFDEGELGGLALWDDAGVGHRYDFSHTGAQYDFRRPSEWLDDDSPGWGASYADMEGRVIPGNSFDYPALYGRVLREAGYTFISAGREAFEQGLYEPADYAALILIFGEQRGVQEWNDPVSVCFKVFTPGMMDAVRRFADHGTGIMVTGAYIGTDMVERKDTLAANFARDVLGYTWRTNHACNSGAVYLTGRTPYGFPEEIGFNAGYDPDIYTAEAPDAIEPAGEKSMRLYRYSATKTSAAVLKYGDRRVAAFGFPFETIKCDEQKLHMMDAVMRFLKGGVGMGADNANPRTALPFSGIFDAPGLKF